MILLLVVFSSMRGISWFSLRGYPNISTDFLKMCTNPKVQITLCTLYTVQKGEFQCLPQHFTICSECARRPCFGPCFRKFPLRRRALWCPSHTLPAIMPRDIITPNNKDPPLSQNKLVILRRRTLGRGPTVLSVS